MHDATYLPERTVDSLFAFELLTAAPTAIIWSPSNNRESKKKNPNAYNIDHEVMVNAHRSFDFECKTVHHSVKKPHVWKIALPTEQLTDYVHAGFGHVIYVFPSRPVDLEHPERRACAQDPNASGACRACSDPWMSPSARHPRRLASLEPHYRTAQPLVKFQPWFNHWAWCVLAERLLPWLVSESPRAMPGSKKLNATDAVLERIPGAVRLCHLLSAISGDWERSSAAVPEEAYNDMPREVLRVNLDAWMAPRDTAALVVPPPVRKNSGTGLQRVSY